MVSMGMESSPMSGGSQCGVCCSAGLKTGWQEKRPHWTWKRRNTHRTVSYGEYLRQREKFITSIFIKCPVSSFALWTHEVGSTETKNWKNLVDPFGVVAISQWSDRQPASHCQMVCSKRALTGSSTGCTMETWEYSPGKGKSSSKHFQTIIFRFYVYLRGCSAHFETTNGNSEFNPWEVISPLRMMFRDSFRWGLLRFFATPSDDANKKLHTISLREKIWRVASWRETCLAWSPGWKFQGHERFRFVSRALMFSASSFHATIISGKTFQVLLLIVVTFHACLHF